MFYSWEMPFRLKTRTIYCNTLATVNQSKIPVVARFPPLVNISICTKNLFVCNSDGIPSNLQVPCFSGVVEIFLYQSEIHRDRRIRNSTKSTYGAVKYISLLLLFRRNGRNNRQQRVRIANCYIHNSCESKQCLITRMYIVFQNTVQFCDTFFNAFKNQPFLYM